MGQGGTTVVQETGQGAGGIVSGHPEGQGHCGVAWGHRKGLLIRSASSTWSWRKRAVISVVRTIAQKPGRIRLFSSYNPEKPWFVLRWGDRKSSIATKLQ